MKNLTLTSVLCIFLLIFGCLQTNNTNNNGITKTTNTTANVSPKTAVEYTYYSSPNFFIYYPKGWKIDQSKNGIFEFSSVLEDQNDKISDGFLVEIWKGLENNSEEFKNYELKLASANDKIIREQNILYKNRDAYVIENKGPNSETNSIMYYKTVFSGNGPWVYRLKLCD